MKFTLILIAVLLIGAASAGQVNEALGPYKVSFSLPMDVRINKSVEHHETYDGSIEYPKYVIDIYNKQNDSRRILFLWIADYNYSMTLDTDEVSNNMRHMMLSGYRTTNYNCTIDSHPGILVVCDSIFLSSTIYYWEYSLNNAVIVGASELPWDKGTLQLLKTIHIEKLTKPQSDHE